MADDPQIHQNQPDHEPADLRPPAQVSSMKQSAWESPGAMGGSSPQRTQSTKSPTFEARPGSAEQATWSRPPSRAAPSRTASSRNVDEDVSKRPSLAASGEALFGEEAFRRKKSMQDLAAEMGAASQSVEEQPDEEEEEDGENLFANDVVGVVDLVDGHQIVRTRSGHVDRKVHETEVYQAGATVYGTQVVTRKKAGTNMCGCWTGEAEDMPDLPERNFFRCTINNSFRRACMYISVNHWIERIYLLSSLAHNMLLLIEQHETSFQVPIWTSWCFIGLYWLELFIKSQAWGLWGGRYSYLNYDTFNRLDFVVTMSGPIEILAVMYGTPFTLRGFRLFRFLKPLMRLEIFHDLQQIILTLEVGAIAQLTVVYLMLFVFVFLGVAGMEAYTNSMRRRCVWADTLEVKQPEQWCKRFDQRPDWNSTGLDSNCGPLQVCRDVGTPGWGFNHFDNMAGSMLSIFQAFSTDGQYIIMWACFQSEPEYYALTWVFWMIVAFLLGQVLVNVFVAVLASVFSRVREEAAKEKSMVAAKQAADAKVDVAEVTESGVTLTPVEQFRAQDPNESNKGDTTSRSGSEASGTKTSFNEDSHSMSKDKSSQKRGMGVLLPGEEIKVHATFSKNMRMIFRSSIAEIVVMIAILGNSLTLAMIGAFDGWDPFLRQCEFWFNIFFTLELVCQIGCDGTLSKFFESGEHIFDFAVVLPTTASLVAEAANATDARLIKVLRSSAILRLFRACKYFFLKPLWLMLQKAASSGISVMNLIFFIFLIISAFVILGRALFEETMDDPRANFKTFFRGFLTMFQVLTGDSWSTVMYDGMKASCQPDLVLQDRHDLSCLASEGCLSCTPAEALVYGGFFIAFFWMGQYVFVTIFLALILEKFSVHEFMHVDRDEDEIQLTREQALTVMAEFQRLPEDMVSKRLLETVFLKFAENPMHSSATVSHRKLLQMVKQKQPKSFWRFLNMIGYVWVRRMIRTHLCKIPLFLCPPWPGDNDFGEDTTRNGKKKGKKKTREQLEQQILKEMGDEIHFYMERIVKHGLAGEARRVALNLNISTRIPENILDTSRQDALTLLRDPGLAAKLGCSGMFDIDPRDMEPEDENEDSVGRTGSNGSQVIGRTASNSSQISKTKSIGDTVDPLTSPKKTKSVPARTSSMASEKNGQPLGSPGRTRSVVARTASLGAAANLAEFEENAVKGIFGHLKARLNRALIVLSTSTIFNFVVYTSIIISSVMLAMETPSEDIPGPIPKAISDYSNLVFIGIFATEAASKIAAFGFYIPTAIEYEAYWQDNWNRLDFIVVCLSIADLFGLGDIVGNNATRVIRVARSLRPLRLLGRNKGMKTTISALLTSTKPIFFAILFLFMVTVVYAVLGMALFKDTFWYCVDNSLDGMIGEGKFECLGSMVRPSDGVYIPRAWIVPGPTFDTFPTSIFTLCRAFTLKWVTVWYHAQDAVAPDIQPVKNFSAGMASTYFVLFIFTGSFFTLNLFVSFIVDGFYAAQGTDSQFDEIQYASLNSVMRLNWPKHRTRPPSNIISVFFRWIIISNWFRNFSASCLILNVLCMSTKHIGQSDEFTQFLEIQNNIFFGIMGAELVMTFVAWGPTLFFEDLGNVFDLFLVAITSALILFASTFRTASQVVRVLRLARFVRQLQSNKLVSAVFETVALSLGQAFNIIVILFVFLSVFAVVGVSQFGTTKYGERLGTTANFGNYPIAMTTLVQIMFGEEWQILMDDLTVQYPECTSRFTDPHTGKLLQYGDCGSIVAPAYLIVLILVCNLTMLNLFVGMIINNFSFCSNKEGNGNIKPECMERLSLCWVEVFDRHATGYIKLEQVYQLMWLVGEPLGFFGEKNNHGRYLCIREDLRRTMEEQETKEKAGTVFERAAQYFREKESDAKEAAFEEWNAHQDTAKKVQKELEEEEEAERKADQEIEQAEKRRAAKREAGDEDEEDEDDGEEDEGEDDADDDNEEEGNRDVEPVEVVYDDEEEGHRKGGRRGRIAGSKFGSESNQVVIMGKHYGNPKGSKAKPKNVKKVKKGYSDPRKLKEEHDLVALEEEEERIKQFEKREKKKLIQRAKKMEKPKSNFSIWFWGSCKKLALRFVSQENHHVRNTGTVRYDHVVQALLYWNKVENVVPKRITESRRVYDDEIILTVADQMIVALVAGFIQRRQARRRRQAAFAMKSSSMVGNMLSRLKSQLASKAAEQAVMEELPEEPKDEEAEESLKLAKETFERNGVTTVSGALANAVLENLMDYRTMRDYAAELQIFLIPRQGLFAVDDESMELLLDHPKLQSVVDDARVKADIIRLLEAGQERVLRIAAQSLAIEIPEEGLSSLSVNDSKALLEEAQVAKRLANLNMAEGYSVSGDPTLLQRNKELMNLKTRLLDREKEKDELSSVLTETQKRYKDLRKEREKLKADLEYERMQMAQMKARYESAAANEKARAIEKAQAEAEAQRQPQKPDLPTIPAPTDPTVSQSQPSELNDSSQPLKPVEDYSSNGSMVLPGSTGFGGTEEHADIADPTKLENAIWAKKTELERLQKVLVKAKLEADHAPDQSVVMYQSNENKHKHRHKAVFDPSATPSMNTAAALGLEMPSAKDKALEDQKAEAPRKKKQTPSWL